MIDIVKMNCFRKEIFTLILHQKYSRCNVGNSIQGFRKMSDQKHSLEVQGVLNGNILGRKRLKHPGAQFKA